MRTLGGVVCGFWRRDVHIHVFVDDGRLLWRSVLWGRTAGVATSSASSNRSGVTVQLNTAESAAQWSLRLGESNDCCGG